MRLHSVTPCNRSAAALAARHLIELGHERILFINKPGRRTIQRRLEGMRDAMGVRFDPALVVAAKDWTIEAGQKALETALAKELDFTAVIAAGDVLGAGAIIALQAAELSIPDQVAVVGIDGLPQNEFLSPQLTTVAIPMLDVGAQSVDMVCDCYLRAGGSGHLPVRRLELGCTLQVRGSTSKKLQ